MIFTHKRKIQPRVALTIEEHPIDEVDYTKFLGIYLDNDKKAYFIYIWKSYSWYWVDHKSKKNVDQWCFADFILLFCVSILVLL